MMNNYDRDYIQDSIAIRIERTRPNVLKFHTTSLLPRRFLVMKILSVNPVSHIQIRCRLSERAGSYYSLQ